jgi:hypothetical protein
MINKREFALKDSKSGYQLSSGHLLCILFLLSAFVSVQSSVIFTSLSSDSLTVGDRIQLSVGLIVPKGAQVIPPPTEQGFGKLVVKDWMTEKAEKSNADSVTFKYLLTVYDAEPCSLQSLPYAVTADGKTDTLKTSTIPLRIGSVIPPNPSETLDIKDIKPLEKAGTPSYLWLWLLIGLTIIIAAILLIRRWLLGKSKPKPEPPPPPPYEEAIEALKVLEAKQYLLKGMIKQHVFELSDIFKRYLERRFEVNAAEFTTEEMLDWIKKSSLERPVKNRADWFFQQTDPVKFAKLIPDEDTIARFLAEVKLFLEETKPQPVTKQSTPANTSTTPQ